MLLCTRTHFIKSLTRMLEGEEGSGPEEERKKTGRDMTERMKMYATDETGLKPGSSVWFWTASIKAREDDTEEEKGVFSCLSQGSQPKPGQRVVYVDGGFDLFSSGHIEFLRQVIKAEEKLGQIVQRILKSRDMYEERQRVKGVKGIGEDAARRREVMEEEQRKREKQAT
ncbi:cytidylyltransferase [Diplocarpon rosae]|nr:cytidylyltransferase [Diplocarpon rosae]